MGNKVTLMWAILQSSAVFCTQGEKLGWLITSKWRCTSLITDDSAPRALLPSRSTQRCQRWHICLDISASDWGASTVRTLHFLPPEQAHACKPSSDWSTAEPELSSQTDRSPKVSWSVHKVVTFRNKSKGLMWTIGTWWRPWVRKTACSERHEVYLWTKFMLTRLIN